MKYLLLFLLIGCSSAPLYNHRFITGKGKQAYVISCRDDYPNKDTLCYEKAGALCPLGYIVDSRDVMGIHTDPEPARWYDEITMTILCKP
jgi:hypothetical protein